MNPTYPITYQISTPSTSATDFALARGKGKTGFGRNIIYAPMANGEFLRSIRIGARAVGWLESDIHQWMKTSRIGAAYGCG
jgi:Predicted transcriptional regulator